MMDEAQYLAGRRPNPQFGTGAFVRAWSMTRTGPNALRVAMEDDFHAYVLDLEHDARQLTGLSARWIRHPITSCPGSELMLKSLVGSPLPQDLRTARQGIDAASHCTHLLDSACLGMIHIAHGRRDRRYDVLIPDRTEGPLTVSLLLNGQPDLALVADRDHVVLQPGWLAGAPLMRGLMRWGEERLADERMERLFMIQRAIFVSWGRQVDLAHYQGQPAALTGPPGASCYGSQPGRYERATRLDGDRFDLTREGALRF